MHTKAQIINKIDLLSNDQIQSVAKYIEFISKKDTKKKEKLNQGQKKLLDLLNHTIDTGIPDLSENLDKYLYKKL